MQAIEFVTKAKNGTISIPKEHLKDLKKEFRVIILVSEEKPKQKISKKKDIATFKVDTKGLTIDREEANVRR